MLEVIGNLWDYYKHGEWVAITTNANINKNGKAVMGAGIALQANKRCPLLAESLAKAINMNGNIPHIFPMYHIISFPTKNNWWEKSDINLIKQSADILENGLPRDIEQLYLPRPGCQNGGLEWRHVKFILRNYLDDRFIVVSLTGEDRDIESSMLAQVRQNNPNLENEMEED